MSNLIEGNLETHEELHADIVKLRDQTHDWMQAMLNRLPVWAVFALTSGATAIGAMGMYILTHK